MDNNIKRAVLYSSGMLGFWNDDKNFTGMNIVVERKKLIHDLTIMGGKIGQSVNEKEVDKLVKDIEVGKIGVEVVENFEKIQNKKRMSKMKVKVHYGMLDTIAEEAMIACNDCSRNMKKCKLRGALLDCNIAKYHDSDVICEYKQI